MTTSGRRQVAGILRWALEFNFARVCHVAGVGGFGGTVLEEVDRPDYVIKLSPLEGDFVESDELFLCLAYELSQAESKSRSDDQRGESFHLSMKASRPIFRNPLDCFSSSKFSFTLAT